MNLRKYVGVAVGLLLLTFSAHSQGVKKPGIGPGRVVMYDVKFDGSDASRIQYVYLRLTLRTPKRPDQGNLPGQLDTVGFGISPDGVFHVSYAIPPEAASGEYSVSFLASVPNNLIQFTYAEGDGLSLPPVTIENDSSFRKPHITVIPKT